MAEEQEATQELEGDEVVTPGKVTVLEHTIEVLVQPTIVVPKHATPDIRVPVNFKPNVTLLPTRVTLRRDIILMVIAAALVLDFIVGLFQ